MANFFKKVFHQVTQHMGGKMNPARKDSPLNPIQGPLAHKVVREIGRASYDAYPVTRNIPVVGTMTALGAATGYSLGGSYGTRHGETGKDLWTEAGKSSLSLLSQGGGAAAAAVGLPPSVAPAITNISNIVNRSEFGGGGAGGGYLDLSALFSGLNVQLGGLFSFLEEDEEKDEDAWDSVPSVISSLGLPLTLDSAKSSLPWIRQLQGIFSAASLSGAKLPPALSSIL